MPSAPHRLATVIALGLLVGCGPPKAGDHCSSTEYDCLDSANAGECRGGAWVQIPCRGAGGCSISNGQVQCALSPVTGDACASTQEGEATCSGTGSTGAGTFEYSCKDGSWTAALCRTCTESSGSVTCQP